MDSSTLSISYLNWIDLWLAYVRSFSYPCLSLFWIEGSSTLAAISLHPYINLCQSYRCRIVVFLCLFLVRFCCTFGFLCDYTYQPTHLPNFKSVN
ncbi:hypothetical protein CDL12_11660 [Handroanthus impetiginosus]|uniref:Uncharacterized protein n=1 Tax=Handroanthus impetiginosus TaxID=429701 RepID=A0A2G9HEH9_9LAMI|nr:hypothetical protein CDL12_11660 [Handroanthus impetiginosus]